MKTNRINSFLFAKPAAPEDKPTGGAPAVMDPPVIQTKPQATEPRKKAIALMGRQAFMAVAEARPELKNALKGYDIALRRLGDGDPAIIQLNNDEITADTVLIGFSVPTNLVVRAKKGIEIPVGRTINRTETSNKVLDEPKVAALIKALAETGRIALRAYSCRVEPLVEHKEADHDIDAEIDSIQF